VCGKSRYFFAASRFHAGARQNAALLESPRQRAALPCRLCQSFQGGFSAEQIRCKFDDPRLEHDMKMLKRSL